MKAFKNFIIFFTFIYVSVFVSSISIGFGFMDKKNSSDSLSLTVGTWYTAGAVIDFEQFTNTTLGVINSYDINGMLFRLDNAVAGNSANDLKNGTTSARIIHVGTITSILYLTGLTTISFYGGMALDSDLKAAKKYEILISNDGVNFTSVFSGFAAKNNDFPFISVDMQSILASGVSMADGSTATSSTPLQVRFSFDGQGPNGTRIYNIDDLTFDYN